MTQTFHIDDIQTWIRSHLVSLYDRDRDYECEWNSKIHVVLRVDTLLVQHMQIKLYEYGSECRYASSQPDIMEIHKIDDTTCTLWLHHPDPYKPNDVSPVVCTSMDELCDHIDSHMCQFYPHLWIPMLDEHQPMPSSTC